MIGIYFLIRKRKIVYIGQTVMFPYRMMNHASKIEFDQVRFTTTEQIENLKVVINESRSKVRQLKTLEKKANELFEVPNGIELNHAVIDEATQN